MHTRHSLLLLATALLAGAPLAAQPALTGPEFFVDSSNQAPSQGHCCPSSATEATGRTMVVWVEPLLEQQPLRGRLLDAPGSPEQPPFTLATGVEILAPPTLSPAAPDGFLLAWQTSESIGPSERRRFFVRRLSPSGEPRGDVIEVQNPVVIVRGFPTTGSLRTASASDGSFVAVWDETNRSTRLEDVFFRLFDAAGRPLTKVASLPSEGGTAKRTTAALTVLDGGEIRIAWWSWSADGTTSIAWVRRFDRKGVPLAAPVRLLPEGVSAWFGSIAFGPGGGCLVDWGDGFRAFAPDGTPFLPYPAPLVGAQVTAERGGTYLLSGTDARDFPDCAVAGFQVAADGTPQGPAGCLTSPSRGAVYAISVTGTGGTGGTGDSGFALFWSEEKRTLEEGSVPRLFGQRLARAGPGTLQIERARSAVLESASEPLALRVVRRDGTAGAVSVDYRLTGAAAGSGTVTFPDGDSTPRAISIPVSGDTVPGNDRAVHVTLSRPTGGAVLGLPQRAVVEIRDDDKPSPLLAHAKPFVAVAEGDSDSEVYGPGLASSSGGDLQVVWAYIHSVRYSDPVRFTYAVQGQRFDAVGKPGTSFGEGASWFAGRVRAAMHPAGDFLVLWQESASDWALGEGDRGYLKRFDASGAALGPEVLLKFLPDGAAPLPGGRFVAVGRGHDAGGEGLFAHFLSTQGRDRRSPALVTRDMLQPGSASVVAADGIGRSVVVWSVAPTGAGPAGIFARRFNALGAPLGPPFRVSQEEGHDLLPGVATDAQGNFAVAWQRSWDGSGTGIYARSFNAAGTPLSDEILVNSETAGDQAAPSVALTGDGRFAVLWQSTSGASSVSEVRGQLFSSTGKRLGSEAQIATAAGTPAIVWSNRGYFVTAVHTGGGIATRRLPL